MHKSDNLFPKKRKFVILIFKIINVKQYLNKKAVEKIKQLTKCYLLKMHLLHALIMNSKIVYLLFLLPIFFSCSKEEIIVENESVIITENFGLRVLSWVNPYSNAKSVVFKSQNGDLEVFDITISEIVARGHVFGGAICQYRNFSFVSRTDTSKKFIMSPLGNSALYLSATPINHPFNPELFMMNFSPPLVSGTFMTQLIYKNADISSFNYKYSTLYPNGLDEELEVVFDAKSNNLFSAIKLKQGQGFLTYRDKNGILWTQFNIN